MFAKAWAIARPIPRLAPVISTWRVRDDIVVGVMDVVVELANDVVRACLVRTRFGDAFRAWTGVESSLLVS